MSKRTDAEGGLTVQVSTGCPQVECEILVVVPDAPSQLQRDAKGWPADYFKLAGSIDDPTFVRQPLADYVDPKRHLG